MVRCPQPLDEIRNCLLNKYLYLKKHEICGESIAFLYAHTGEQGHLELLIVRLPALPKSGSLITNL